MLLKRQRVLKQLIYLFRRLFVQLVVCMVVRGLCSVVCGLWRGFFTSNSVSRSIVTSKGILDRQQLQTDSSYSQSHRLSVSHVVRRDCAQGFKSLHDQKTWCASKGTTSQRV